MSEQQKHVFVCTQSRPSGHPRGSCAGNSSSAILNEFLAELKARGLLERIGVTGTGCLGPCGQGPSVLVFPGGVLYNPVNKPAVKEIIEQHLLNGTPVERLRVPTQGWG